MAGKHARLEWGRVIVLLQGPVEVMGDAGCPEVCWAASQWEPMWCCVDRLMFVDLVVWSGRSIHSVRRA